MAMKKTASKKIKGLSFIYNIIYPDDMFVDSSRDKGLKIKTQEPAMGMCKLTAAVQVISIGTYVRRRSYELDLGRARPLLVDRARAGGWQCGISAVSA